MQEWKSLSTCQKAKGNQKKAQKNAPEEEKNQLPQAKRGQNAKKKKKGKYRDQVRCSLSLFLVQV